MQYRKLGNSGLVVSTLGLGTMYFGAETSESDAFSILDGFVEAGGNLIDTADAYVKTESEKIVGRWLAARPSEVTNRIVLATKGRVATSPDVNDSGTSRRHLHRALNASLARLGVETIDLYQIHAWDPQTPVEETLRFLDEAVRAGKIHYAGLSNYTGWQLQLMLSTAKSMNLNLPVTLQQQYSLLSRESEWEVIPAALYNNIGLLPWSPLAGGFLTGKYRRGGKPRTDTRAGSESGLYQWVSNEYAELDRNWAVIDAVVRVAKNIGATPSQVALSWLGKRPCVTAPIFGARTLAQLNENLAAVHVRLDDAATAELDTVSAPVSGGYPYGEFGQWQRARWIQDPATAPFNPILQGSEHPLGRG